MEFRFEIPVYSPRAMAVVTEWRPSQNGTPVVVARHVVDLPGIERWLQHASPLGMGDKVFFQIELVPFPDQQPDPSHDVADRKDAMCAVIDAELAGIALQFIEHPNTTDGLLDMTLSEDSLETIEIDFPWPGDQPASEDFCASAAMAISAVLSLGSYVCEEDDDGA